MGVFKSEKFIPARPSDLRPVADAVMEHFRHRGFEVSGIDTLTGGWDLSLHQGNIFKAVLGLKTALKVSIEPAGQGTLVKAGIGIFGQQAIPTAIMLFVFWPVIVTQLWGLVRQSKLDDEAVTIVEQRLLASGPAPAAAPVFSPSVAETPPPGSNRFCTACGMSLPAQAKFCPSCGQPQTAAAV